MFSKKHRLIISNWICIHSNSMWADSTSQTLYNLSNTWDPLFLPEINTDEASVNNYVREKKVLTRLSAMLKFYHMQAKICVVYAVLRLASSFRQEQVVRDTNGNQFYYMTPLCSVDVQPTLFIVPQSRLTCFVTVTTPTNTTRVRLSKGVSKRIPVDCAAPEWNSLGEVGGQVKSSCEIALYVEYKTDNYIVHPLDSAGYKYSVLVPHDLENWECFIAIYPIRNGTNITIMADAQTAGYFLLDDSVWSKNDKKYLLGMVLYELETIYIKCMCSLSGIQIMSRDPLMVVAGGIPQNDPETILIEQLTPANTWGRQFILPPQTLQQTEIKLYITGKGNGVDLSITTDTTNSSIMTIASFPYVLEMEGNEYVYITSNISILPILLTRTKDDNIRSQISLQTVPPVAECLPRLRFNDIDSQKMTVSFWGRFVQSFLINLEDMVKLAKYTNWTFGTMFLYANVTEFDNFEITTKRRIYLFPSVCGVVETVRNNITYRYSMGMRQTDIYEACSTTNRLSYFADGMDNDCDGIVDEELRNRRDDDGDGFIDEDIGTWIVFRRKANVEVETYRMEMSVIAVIISIVVAIVAVIAFIGGMVVADHLMGGNVVAPVRDSPELQ